MSGARRGFALFGLRASGPRTAARRTGPARKVAIVSTKIPILLGHGFGGFADPKVARHGFVSMAHEARTDFSMLFGSLFLLVASARAWSIDALVLRRRTPTPR